MDRVAGNVRRAAFCIGAALNCIRSRLGTCIHILSLAPTVYRIGSMRNRDHFLVRFHAIRHFRNSDRLVRNYFFQPETTVTAGVLYDPVFLIFAY